jgi:hypothetical protein
MKLLHPVRDLVHQNVFVAAVHARAMNKNGDKYDNLYSRSAGISLYAHHKYFTQSMEQNSLNAIKCQRNIICNPYRAFSALVVQLIFRPMTSR